MEIKTVKIQGNGYLRNGTMSVPKADGNREYELIKEWLIDNNPEPEFTVEELTQQEIAINTAKAKEAKQLALDTITVEVDGMVFDGRDKDQIRMMAAIQASEILGIGKTEWKLADNTVATVTVDTLELVLAASIQEVGRIVKGE